jgi:hypothetical protein
MSTDAYEIEGTWEEIKARDRLLAGRRLRVTVLPSDAPPLTEEQHEMLAAADRLQFGAFPPEERVELERLDDFLASNRFSLRPPAYFEPDPETVDTP